MRHVVALEYKIDINVISPRRLQHRSCSSHRQPVSTIPLKERIFRPSSLSKERVCWLLRGSRAKSKHASILIGVRDRRMPRKQREDARQTPRAARQGFGGAAAGICPPFRRIQYSGCVLFVRKQGSIEQHNSQNRRRRMCRHRRAERSSKENFCSSPSVRPRSGGRANKSTRG